MQRLRRSLRAPFLNHNPSARVSTNNWSKSSDCTSKQEPHTRRHKLAFRTHRIHPLVLFTYYSIATHLAEGPHRSHSSGVLNPKNSSVNFPNFNTFSSPHPSLSISSSWRNPGLSLAALRDLSAISLRRCFTRVEPTQGLKKFNDLSPASKTNPFLNFFLFTSLS